MNKKPLVIAHRGAAAYAPENTLEAFALALKMGADGLEMDVRMTKDGVLILSHDRGVKAGRRRSWIDKIKFSKLKKIKNGEIPTLEEALSKFGRITALELDLKQEGIEEAVVKLLKKYQPKKKIVIKSVSIKVLKKFKKLYPSAVLSHSSCELRDSRDLAKRRAIRALCYFLSLTGKPLILRFIKRRTRKAGVDFVSLHYRLANKKLIDFFHRKGVKVSVWTINDEELGKKFLDFKVEALITDRPDIIRKMVDNYV